jgi:hypothetical protein
VPFVEVAHFSAEMRQFFDYIKQEQRRGGRGDEEERRQ